jgi:ornithine decarboxylase
MKAIHIGNRASGGFLTGVDFHRLNELTRTFPTPFMILRIGQIRRNLQSLRRALPGIDVYYAVKANNHPDIIRALADERCCFDISSVRELRSVLDCGGKVNDTIHTNPIKSQPEFDGAIELGVRTFVADNASELEKFRNYGDKAGVLLRFKTDQGGSAINLSYKFGTEMADIPDMLERIKALGLKFRGFCFHVGSQCTEPQQYVRAIKEAGELIALAAQKGMKTEMLDIGGGFPIKYTREIPAIEDIGAAITHALDTEIDSGIRIICEPGRIICGEAITLFSSVIGKSVRDGVKWYYIDDGLYGSFSGRLFDDCTYQVLTSRNTKWEKAVLAGPTCDSFDVIYKECLMPPLDIGDVLMFPAMGAYCSVSASDFNGLGRARTFAVDW